MSKRNFERKVDLGASDVKTMVKELVQTNERLVADGHKRVSMEIIGEAGLGKTSIIHQVGEELNKPVIKINLSQLDELGDLVGFPQKEYEVVNIDSGHPKEGKRMWVNEKAADQTMNSGKWAMTNKTRMGYALPEWLVNNRNNPNGCILLIDDYSRAQARFMQATMEIIDRGQFYSWELPQNWTVLMTSNPPDKNYLVAATDVAQQTRYISVNMIFDKEMWAAWAENSNIDGRCINFVLHNPEVIEDGIEHGVNPRSLVNFFNSIRYIDDFSTKEALKKIRLFGEAAIGQWPAGLFVNFINNRLDKLPNVDFILFDPNWDKVERSLVDVIGRGSGRKGAIAYVLSNRVINRSIKYAKENTLDDKFIDRLEDLITNEIFGVDVSYNLTKKIHSSNTQKFGKLAVRKKLMKYLGK
jgi:hypothetical protein